MTSRVSGLRRRRWWASALLLVLAGSLSACSVGSPPEPSSTPTSTSTSAAAGKRPNVIVVMADDLSFEIAKYMPAVRDLRAEGTEFTNYFVSTSRCCPSRATFFTGRYPQNTGVLTNRWANMSGGFAGYRDNIGHDLGPVLQQAGYRTGLVGKYLNEYRPDGSLRTETYHEPYFPSAFVPSGWNEWHGTGGAYAEFDYVFVDAVDSTRPAGPAAPPGFIGSLVGHPGYGEEQYFTTVAGDLALDFLDRASAASALPDPDQVDPFALVVTPFATHQGGVADPGGSHISFPANPADRPRICPPGAECPVVPEWNPPDYNHGDCGDHALPPPRGGGCAEVPFPDPMWVDTYVGNGDRDPSTPPVRQIDPPTWLGNQPPLTSDELGSYRELYLQRIQMAQSVSDLIYRLRAKLAELHMDDDTYLVFTSDNGYYLGQHGLTKGKSSPYDHDVKVPLIIDPPGDEPLPRTVDDLLVQNTDLAPTIAELAGTSMPQADGTSVVPWIRLAEQPEAPPDVPSDWRDVMLLTYVFDPNPEDPDSTPGSAIIPTFAALRTADYLYVDYRPRDHEPPASHATGEFYDLGSDPQEMNNRFDELRDDNPGALRALNELLEAYQRCSAEPAPAVATCQQLSAVAPHIQLGN